MKDVMTREPTPAETACRHLAVRVIEQAVQDLSASGASSADRKSARGFLSGSPMLYRWCELANVSASSMMGRAAGLVKPSGRPRIRTAASELVRSCRNDSGPTSKSVLRQRRMY